MSSCNLFFRIFRNLTMTAAQWESDSSVRLSSKSSSRTCWSSSVPPVPQWAFCLLKPDGLLLCTWNQWQSDTADHAQAQLHCWFQNKVIHSVFYKRHHQAFGMLVVQTTFMNVHNSTTWNWYLNPHIAKHHHHDEWKVLVICVGSFLRCPIMIGLKLS